MPIHLCPSIYAHPSIPIYPSPSDLGESLLTYVKACLDNWCNKSLANAKCPECRAPIEFVVSWSTFATSKEHHTEIIRHHRERVSKVPCRLMPEIYNWYAAASGGEHQEKWVQCPSGNNCQYLHVHPQTGMPYRFSQDRRDALVSEARGVTNAYWYLEEDEDGRPIFDFDVATPRDRVDELAEWRGTWKLLHSG